MDIMGNLYDKYKHRNDIQNVMKTTKEMEKIEEEFTDADNKCRDYLIESKVVKSSVGSLVSRISKRDNVNSKIKWKHVSTQAPATKEYKLLQLRQYVEGEALQVIENLGHSAVAYDAAKERLERKYGGQRRQITLYIEELENFKPMSEGIAKDMEHFADLLDIAVCELERSRSFRGAKEWFFVQQIAAKDDRIYVVEVSSLDFRKRNNRVSRMST
ncbi:unnamed protein product [Mytilus edulis]|uniref:Uncharacterized protein n=1 Tax=Mytilus edulis TaxID=6550 RepID=A0A8S3RZ34_MYTED|nr:unnamed protein product [Mytilus edulis]